MDTLTALEVRTLLQEILAIGKISLAGSLTNDVLARIDRIMQQAVNAASNIVAGASGRASKKRTE